MKRIIALCLLLAPILAHAQANLTATLTPPTQNANGTAIAAGTTFTYFLYSIPCTGSGTPALITSGTALTYPVPNAPPGTNCYAATATASLNGQTSAASTQSVTVTVSVPVAVPKPPGLNVVIPVVTGANTSPVFPYAAGVRQVNVAGFVPVGTTCMGKSVFGYRGQLYYQVPKASVQWWDGVYPVSNIAAPCAAGSAAPPS